MLSCFPSPSVRINFAWFITCLPLWPVFPRLHEQTRCIRSHNHLLSTATCVPCPLLIPPTACPQLVTKPHHLRCYPQVVEPKRQKLREAEQQLADANAKLAEKQGVLREVEGRVEALRQRLAQAQREQKSLADQVRAGCKGRKRGWVEGVAGAVAFALLVWRFVVVIQPLCQP